MFQPQFFYEAGKARSGTALIPFTDTIYISRFGFSTRNGDAIIKWGDGSETNYVPNKNTTSLSYVNKTYTSAFTGNVEVFLKNGLKDVYFLNLSAYTNTFKKESKYNIINFGNFIKQFTNLYGYTLDLDYFFQPTLYSTVSGNLLDVPNSVELIVINRIQITNTDLSIDFDGIPLLSKLKYLFRAGGSVNSVSVFGDLAKLPTLCFYCNIQLARTGSSITYTAGKIWASAFDTLYLPIALTLTENDNLLIDANNSVTTAIGGKLFDLKGFRTLASDDAVAGLIAKGFTVNCTRISDTMLTMPLSANLLDSSSYSNNATMVGTETHSLGGLQTSTGNYAYIPNKTSLDFGTGSLRFGCTVKFSSVSGTKGIIGKTIFGAAVGRYGIYFDAGTLYGITQITAGNIINSTSISPYNDGNFHNIEVVCNRTTGKQSLIIDGIIISTVSFAPSSDNISRNAQFMIGAYGNSTGTGLLASSELNGVIKDVFVNKF